MRVSEETAAASIIARVPVRPFVKWAGGKRQLLTELRRFIPATFSGYHEPFLGSGALFFDLWTRGFLDGRAVSLSDNNADLIGCYLAIRNDVEALIALLASHERAHREGPEAHYYRVRDELFNPARVNCPPPRDSAELAAMFLYLNRTGFNGLFRLNSRGGFNVPAGRYARPTICDARNLRAVSAALSADRISLRQAQYESVLDRARSGDLIYFDPPYAPLSTTARFTSYTADGFCDEDQRRLQQVACELVARGCHVVISNSTAAVIGNLYRQAPGLHVHEVAARRAINSNARRRGGVMEYIISNVRPVPRRPAGARRAKAEGGSHEI
jgi:DNA adenine methylase